MLNVESFLSWTGVSIVHVVYTKILDYRAFYVYRANKSVWSTGNHSDFFIICKNNFRSLEKSGEFCFIYFKITADKNTCIRNRIKAEFVFCNTLEVFAVRSLWKIQWRIDNAVNKSLDKVLWRCAEEFFHVFNWKNIWCCNFFKCKVCFCHCRSVFLACSLFDVCSISAVTENECVVTDWRLNHEFFWTWSTHGSSVCLYRNDFKTKALEDSVVCLCIILICFIKWFIISMKWISICHVEFTAAHNSITRTDFITVLCVDLICVDWQLLVWSKSLAHDCSVCFFCSRRNNHVLFTTVFCLEHLRTHCVPSSTFLPYFSWNNYSRLEFTGTNIVPFFFDYVFNLAVCFQSERHVSIKTVSELADKISSHHKLMTRNLSLCRGFT